jgi:hypothetical protein
MNNFHLSKIGMIHKMYCKIYARYSKSINTLFNNIDIDSLLLKNLTKFMCLNKVLQMNHWLRISESPASMMDKVEHL